MNYLGTLSADGVPPLLELPAEVRGCILPSIEARLDPAAGPWSSFNLSRERARDLLAEEDSLCTLP